MLKSVLTASCASLAVCAFAPSLASAQQSLSKGYQLLLNHGIQLQGMVTPDDVFHLSTYQDIGYTSVSWFSPTGITQLGPPPGYLWSRWVQDPNQFPPTGDEGPYMPQCIGLAIMDEQNLSDSTVRDNLVNVFNGVTGNPAYANTLLYTNNYGGQAPDNALADFVARAKPDMLFFDTYPFKSSYDVNAPDHIGAAQPADVLPWESELRRYRAHSIADGIPFGAYMQTFHAVQDYDQTVYRDPSPSELRFNNNAAIAFNAKWLTGFTYNTGASSLFTRPGGDSNPTPLYQDQKLVNTRLKNWSNTLTRLTPIYDLHNPNDANPPPGPASTDVNFPDGTTTSMMILRGKNSAGTTNGIPIGFQSDPQAVPTLQYSWWEFQKNDPYFNGWGVTNVGTKNAGQIGDVIISWFRVLDEKMDGSSSGEIYMMITNALTDPTGSAADCTQTINLKFLNLPDGDLSTLGNQGIAMLDPDTGSLMYPTLPSIGSGKVQLQLTLAGGDAALFKFNDGAPFVGVPEPTSAMALLGMASLLLRRSRMR